MLTFVKHVKLCLATTKHYIDGFFKIIIITFNVLSNINIL